ncbi:hypothetical protein AGMMS49546_27550 [Spirochaetia bacterium]|nr:hypothetical protein AGMMS49546_27550 [Spirochaetia bacterium]
MRNFYKLFVLFVCIFTTACATNPELKLFLVSENVKQFFIPPTEWKNVNSNNVLVDLDITYNTDPASVARCNISFKGSKKSPHEVTSASFIGDGVSYTLQEISYLYLNSSKKTLRISTKSPPENIIAVLESKAIALKAVVDGVEYQFVPSKSFLTLKDQFLEEYRY